MPLTIIKPPCSRCGRRDLPVWLGKHPLCDICHDQEMIAQARRIADLVLADFRQALNPGPSTNTGEQR